MAWTPIDGSVPQYSTEDNELASGYYLKFYQSGTTTPLSMSTDSTGNVKLAKCKLNPRGMPITNPLDDDTVFIPHVDQAYRIVLYKNETDADNDATASAEYNVDGIAPDISPAADAADITLRTNSLEAWDDYDRSPLFVDGTDFTAGAGPHTITIPTGWDATDSDMRFWRLDAPSDSVQSLTPTSVATGSFTLAETLLSTDVVFIGDDQFRNIHDGDPADILERLLGTSAADGSVSTTNLEDGLLSADAAGRAKMANGFLSADATGRAKMADSFVSTAKLNDGLLTADAAGRAKMADEYVTSAKLEAVFRSLILASASLQVQWTPGPAGIAGAAWVDIPGGDTRDVWYNPRDAGGTRVGRMITIHNPGPESTYLNIRIETTQDNSDDERIRLLKNGVAVETSSINPATTYTFGAVEITAGQFSYFELQAQMNGGSGNDIYYLDSVHVWLTTTA